MTIALCSAACSGGGEASGTSAGTTTAPATTTATTTQPPPLSAEEQAWWRRVDHYANRLEKDWHRSKVTITHAVMRHWSSLFAKCKTTLKKGNPDRYAPVARIVRRACDRLTKARGQFSIAIGASDAGGAVIAGTPEEDRFTRALERASALAENALNDFSTASARASTIEAEFGT